MLETYQRGVGYLGRICDALEKLARIDIPVALDELESGLENKTQEKKKREK